MKISIVIPAYNEERTLGPLLERSLAVEFGAGAEREIIVVDDGSSDATADVARRFAVRLLQQSNQGKGAAVQAGVRAASGDYVFVQDADLEYLPEDVPALLAATGGESNVVVYGSRPLGVICDEGVRPPFVGKHRAQGVGPWGMNAVLSAMVLGLYGRGITDPLTGSKLYPREMLLGLNIETRGFETDHEITAKLLRAGARIREVPIRYVPRSVAEGKKIRAIDGWIAMRTLFRYRAR